MTDAGEPVEEADLQALVDGRLPSERAKAVEAHIAAHPELRERFLQYAAQRHALREAFAEDDRTIPSRFQVARLLAERRRQQYAQLSRIAAAICLLVLGGIGGWAARYATTPPVLSATATTAHTLTTDAIAAHRIFAVETRHPVEVGADQGTDLVQWLSHRLGRALVIPDLAALGFRLIGGRLLPSEGGPAAQLMYEDGKGERLTLYLRAGISGETKLHRQDRGLGAFYWADEGLACVIVAAADRALLLRAAESAYTQIFPNAAKGEFSREPATDG
jgi:anti-sigma factor RsiW